MNRRKLLAVLIAAPAVAVLPTIAKSKVEVRYKNAADHYWAETLHDESVEFGVAYDWERNCHLVRAYWRDHETPRRSYALGWLATREEFVDSGHKDIIDFVKGHKHTQTLRIAMSNTIRRINGITRYSVCGWNDSGICAPWKPEGSVTPVIRDYGRR